MSPLTDHQLERIQEERKLQIKKAALKVFALQGITGTKMSSIAAEAGISQGLSYRYFSSKEELYTELVQEALAESESALDRIHELPGSPSEQIRAFTRVMLDPENRLYFLLIRQVQVSDDAPETAKQLIKQHSPEKTIGRIVPIFVKGQEEGEFYEGDPGSLLLCYFSAITGLMLQESPFGEDFWFSQVDVFMRMIRKM
ncbi:TetR/AcrR family transcriptional regulator [Paenibacillus sp. KQZ6P-2]|uniref:TetR/AcrR family transcriptional regulator n=1 Tax=Paenibacillus mangrovi TaxID=2931978 RepID=A0A9X1WQ78_9BACL|nr:TetR/AcrR family transcriptional regulator [Paenibacillus mangrovi]MCJ8011683.1 TetR/AcrR family transcriptional regulator [Paenibacillus mangrovi]